MYQYREMSSIVQGMTQVDAAAKAGFTTLPGELHDMVCGFIKDTKTLRSVRNTCKTLRGKTEEIYHKRMYSSLEINLTVENLEYVVKVSKHSRYSPLVQKIVIRPAFLDRVTCRDGNDSSLLEKALRNLENLQSIEILPYETGCDTLLRARANARVPAVGDRNYNPRVVIRRDPALVHDPISHAFYVVRKALRHSKSVVHLKAGTAPTPSGERNSVDHAVIQATTYYTSTCLAQLESFHLVASAYGASLNIETSLANLLRPMHRLKSLRLEFWGYNIEWLSKTFEDVTFTDLKELSIQAVRKVKATALSDFVQRHKNTLESLELSIITFDDDMLATTFPTILQDVRLHKLKLSQLCSARHGLLLLGATCETICNACYKDLNAAWKFKMGPHCHHASVNVTGGELTVSRALAQRLETVDLLPWPARPPPPVMFPITEAVTDEVQENESEHAVMEDQAAPADDTAAVPAIARPSNIGNLADPSPAGHITSPSDRVTRSIAAAWAPPHRRILDTQLDPAPSGAPVRGIIELTADSVGEDGPYGWYQDYGGGVTVEDQGNLLVSPLTLRGRDTIAPGQTNFTAVEAENQHDSSGRRIGDAGTLRSRPGSQPAQDSEYSKGMMNDEDDEDDEDVLYMARAPRRSEEKREERGP